MELIFAKTRSWGNGDIDTAQFGRNIFAEERAEDKIYLGDE